MNGVTLVTEKIFLFFLWVIGWFSGGGMLSYISLFHSLKAAFNASK